MREDRDEHESDLEGADRQGDPLHAPVGAGHRHRRQDGDGDEHAEPDRQVQHRADGGDTAELGQQRADARDDKRPRREPRPDRAVVLADEHRMALAGDDAEPDGQLLHEIEDRNQQDLEEQELVTVLRATLRCGDDRASIGVGEHDEDARPEDGDEMPEARSDRGTGLVDSARCHADPSRAGAAQREGRPEVRFRVVCTPRG